jgi:hypothetical protein
MCLTEKDVTERVLGGDTETSARALTDNNEGSSSSRSDYEAQLVVVELPAKQLEQNDVNQRRRRYEQKIDAMAVKKLKQACRNRSLAVGGTKAVLLKRLKPSANANGKNAAGKAKRQRAGGKRKISSALETHIHEVDEGPSEDFMESRPAGAKLEQQETTTTPVVSICQKRPQSPQRRNPNMTKLRPRLRSYRQQRQKEENTRRARQQRGRTILGFDELENEIGGLQQS